MLDTKRKNHKVTPYTITKYISKEQTNNMNSVTYKELKREIGQQGIYRIDDLRNWILDNSASIKEVNKFRIAPSIITRCEGEIFNLSMPRFAIRVYLNNQYRGFVNARRTSTFWGQLRPWADRTTPLKDRNTKLHIDTAKKGKAPDREMPTIPCTGDCILPVPDRIEDIYYVLKKKLGIIYGEPLDILGTPYIRHIDMAGGGLCAQAACFIATLLLNNYANGIFGIADITTIASGIRRRELILSGLNYDAISRYFESDEVGLRGVWQRPDSWGDTVIEGFSKPIRSYLLSGCPVILPTDLGRSRGIYNNVLPEYEEKSIYDSNFDPEISPELKLEPLSTHDFEHDRPQHHAVVIVGCSRDDTNNSFVFHDPTVMPYMTATATQLIDAFCYTNDLMDGLIPPFFLPITPSEVLMSLSSWHSVADVSSDKWWEYHLDGRNGLLQLAQRLQVNNLGTLPVFTTLSDSEQYDPGIFRLLQISQIGTFDFIEECLFHEGDSITDAVDSLMTNQGISKDHWVWLQYSDNCKFNDHRCKSVWIWNAQQKVPDSINDANELSCLIAVFVSKQKSWQQIYPAKNVMLQLENSRKKARETTKIIVQDIPCDDEQKKFKKTLITSFSGKGIQKSFEYWPKDIKQCDMYVFMQDDSEKYMMNLPFLNFHIRKFISKTIIDYLRNVYRALPFEILPWLRKVKTDFGLKSNEPSLGIRKPMLSARRRMATKRLKSLNIRKCADTINRTCRKNELEICAITTFLPGLASQTGLKSVSQNALDYVIRLAKKLKQDYKHPIKTIELVAGSLVDGIWPGIHEDEGEVYVANILKKETAIKNFAINLRPIAEIAAKAGIALAVELEPGPNYIINDINALELLSETIKGDAILDKIVGFNLDIAHWSMAGIEGISKKTSSIISKTSHENIVDRIIHAHVSDHGAGHLADLAIESIHDSNYFDRWRDFINTIYAKSYQRTNEPKYSGYVSLEIEATHSYDAITNSFNKSFFS